MAITVSPVSGRIFTISEGVHHLESTSDELVGAYVFGEAAGACSYSYPAGICLQREFTVGGVAVCVSNNLLSSLCLIVCTFCVFKRYECSIT